jgi:hypothetical protein
VVQKAAREGVGGHRERERETEGSLWSDQLAKGQVTLQSIFNEELHSSATLTGSIVERESESEVRWCVT